METLFCTPTVSVVKNYCDIPINTPLIDSTTIRIPLSECEVISDQLVSLTATIIQATGEVINENSPPVPIIIRIDGVKFKFSVEHIPIYNKQTRQKIQTPFISFLLTTKILRHRYFEGINIENLEYFYNEFMSYNLIKCSFETFKNAQPSDTDICINRYVKSKNCFIDIINDLYIATGTKQQYVRPPIAGTDGIGLVFMKRKTSKPTLPFIKLYHKEIELQTKSFDFYKKYLSPHYDKKIKNLTRIEATIKNAKHKYRLIKYNVLPEYNTLKDLVQISKRDLKKFIIFSIDSYISKRIRRKAPNLAPKDHLIFELMQNCLINGADFESILLVLNSYKGTTPQNTANSRYKMRKLLTELFDLLIHKDLKIQTKINNNNHVLEYLRYLGLKV